MFYKLNLNNNNRYVKVVIVVIYIVLFEPTSRSSVGLLRKHDPLQRSHILPVLFDSFLLLLEPVNFSDSPNPVRIQRRSRSRTSLHRRLEPRNHDDQWHSGGEEIGGDD